MPSSRRRGHSLNGSVLHHGFITKHLYKGKIHKITFVFFFFKYTMQELKPSMCSFTMCTVPQDHTTYKSRDH